MTTPKDLARTRNSEALPPLTEVRAYWNAHPIATDSVSHEVGTPESFAAMYDDWMATVDQMRIDFLESCRDKRVLEIGCGTARDGRFLCENGIDYRAVDQSVRSLQLARRHFELAGLPPRFIAGDARNLPFEDDQFDLVFSIGVLHHSPDTPRSCKELARVTRPGGTVRVMLYNRKSYHYLLVEWVIRPILWLMLRVPFLARLLALAPAKIREMYEVCHREGFDRNRILSISTDSSFAGAENFNPVSQFFSEVEFREMFCELKDHHFIRRELKYFPIPFFRSFFERRWGFFLTMTACKSEPSGP